MTVGCAFVPMSDSVKNLGVTLGCHLTMKTPISSLVSSASSELRHISSMHHPQMPQKLLFLPLFFQVLTTVIRSCLAVLSISYTNYKKFKTTLLALS